MVSGVKLAARTVAGLSVAGAPAKHPQFLVNDTENFRPSEHLQKPRANWESATTKERAATDEEAYRIVSVVASLPRALSPRSPPESTETLIARHRSELVLLRLGAWGSVEGLALVIQVC